MKKPILLVLALVSVAGCVDTPDSICREFLNANNEHIDALMMVTSERQAKHMTIRVFSHMNARYEALDKKWDIMEQGMGNKPSQEDMKTFLESDGFHLYRSEYKMNAQRCTLELARLRNLWNQYVEYAKELEKEKGEPINPKERWPALYAIIFTKNILNPLRMQLEKPKLEQVLVRFNNRVEPGIMEAFKKKQDIFNPKDRPEIKLAR
jgi:hypothetical protein